MSGSLTVDLGEGYRRLGQALPPLRRAEVACVREAFRVRGGRVERARRLTALVLAYRSGPRELWAPVLLDVLAPAMLERLQQLRVQPPFMDEEDIRQELVVEVLSAASSMPLPSDPTFLRGRLMARANQGVRRRLIREQQRQRSQVALEAGEVQPR